MSILNSVISRLQNQRNRIQGMLSPGKKFRQAGESLHTSLSPVASDFAGRKFQLAARKMRSLDPLKLGKTMSGDLTSLSTGIHNKFAEIQKIIHFNPVSSRPESIWSSLETPLPEAQPARQESSLEPGTLRAGSIIQKMSTVPQPGQTLDSFKDQVQKQPRTTKPSLDRKPIMDKNTRRFSQVQELTPGQKTSLPAMPAVPVKPGETQTAVIGPGEKPEIATIQTQPDPSASVPKKTGTPSRQETPSPKPVRPSGPPELPAQQVKTVSLPEMPSSVKPHPSQPTALAGQQTSPGEVSSQPADTMVVHPEESPRVTGTKAGQPPQAQIPVEDKEILKALPVSKKPPEQVELKKALPVKKEKKETQKPVARPAQISRPQAAPASIRPVIQRQPDSVLQVAAPVRPAIQQPSQTTGPTQKLPVQSTPAETDAGKPELPLRQNIDYRQNAPRSLRAIASESMKPADQTPLIHREDKPLLTRSKYRTTSIESPRPALSAMKESVTIKKQDQPLPQPGIPAALPLDKPQRSQVSQAATPLNLAPIPMPLVSPVAAPAPEKQASKPEAVFSPVQSQVKQIPTPTPTLAKTNNTIQRTWEGHTPPAQQSSGESGGQNESSESTNLQALAENVFPYVKRILEIEAFRSSGKFR